MSIYHGLVVRGPIARSVRTVSKFNKRLINVKKYRRRYSNDAGRRLSAVMLISRCVCCWAEWRSSTSLTVRCSPHPRSSCLQPSSSLSVASCLIHAWALPAHPIQYVIVDRLGAFFYWTTFIWQQCAVLQYHSDLPDQSALEIRVMIMVRLRVALI